MLQAAAGAEIHKAGPVHELASLAPYPFYTLAEWLDTIAREISIGEMHPRSPVRRGVLDLTARRQHGTGRSAILSAVAGPTPGDRAREVMRDLKGKIMPTFFPTFIADSELSRQNSIKLRSAS